MKIIRSRIHVVLKGNVTANLTDIHTTIAVPAAKIWHIKRITFGTTAINDGLSDHFEVDWGIGVQSNREVLIQAFLLGNSWTFPIDRTFHGDGTDVFRLKRTNNSSTDKKMFILFEGFKREGDL